MKKLYNRHDKFRKQISGDGFVCDCKHACAIAVVAYKASRKRAASQPNVFPCHTLTDVFLTA